MTKRRLATILLLSLLAVVAVARLQVPRFENEIVAFENADKKNPPGPVDVLFVGSSSIRLWTTLTEDFPEYRVLNRGFGGSWISDSVRNADRIVTPYKPKAIVFYAGTNDLADGKSPETILSDYNAFVTKVRAKLPDVPIAFIAVSPAPSRYGNVANIKRANRLVETYSAHRPGLRFIDTFPLMLENGGPWPDIFVADQLHMKPQGYAIWKKAVVPVLAEMLKR